MDLYEVGVYLVIIVVASVCVFGIMWLLMRSMQPKRSRVRRRVASAAAAAGGRALKEVPEKSPVPEKEKKNNKNKKEKKKKEPKVREEKLLELKELPDNRLLEPNEATAPSKDAPKDESGQKDKTPSESDGKAEVNAGETKQGEATAGEAAAGQENADVALPDLPSMDTLTEEEDTAPKEDTLDLMSVFETEDAEDSTTSDLAANLFDVDVQNIEKLGSEVSEFLGGMRSK
jgi:hypothetical protein